EVERLGRDTADFEEKIEKLCALAKADRGAAGRHVAMFLGNLHDISQPQAESRATPAIMYRTMEIAATAASNVIELEKQYLLQNYARYPLVLTRGKGCYVYDDSGKRYLDLIAGIGVNALGHNHPRLVKVIREQAAKMIHCSNL